MLSFWGSILGGAIAALLGFGAVLLVENYRHRRQKVTIIKALQREISYNNAVIQDMIKSGWRSEEDSLSPFERLQSVSYIKARESGVVAIFSDLFYNAISSVYDTIYEIHRFRNEGRKIQGTVSGATINVIAFDEIHKRHNKIANLQELPEKLLKLEITIKEDFSFLMK